MPRYGKKRTTCPSCGKIGTYSNPSIVKCATAGCENEGFTLYGTYQRNGKRIQTGLNTDENIAHRNIRKIWNADISTTT